MRYRIIVVSRVMMRIPGKPGTTDRQEAIL